MITATDRQGECLDIIRESIAETGTAPSYDEIADRMGLVSKGNVVRYVNGLEERGLIRRIPRRARAIEIVEPRLPTPAELQRMTLADLERHLGHISGVLAHKGGVSHLRAMFDRIGNRLAGRRAA
jgi:SOS-response transcriptional repressor LexA